jgi:hypothetical protein
MRWRSPIFISNNDNTIPRDHKLLSEFSQHVHDVVVLCVSNELMIQYCLALRYPMNDPPPTEAKYGTNTIQWNL